MSEILRYFFFIHFFALGTQRSNHSDSLVTVYPFNANKRGFSRLVAWDPTNWSDRAQVHRKKNWPWTDIKSSKKPHVREVSRLPEGCCDFSCTFSRFITLHFASFRTYDVIYLSEWPLLWPFVVASLGAIVRDHASRISTESCNKIFCIRAILEVFLEVWRL